jgi:hypothetical protein
MNYIRHLNSFFFQHVKRDRRLTASHISLYLALFQSWNYNRFQNPFFITRDEVMSITGIGSKNTYLKCMKELHQFGYIFYSPSKNRFQKSKIWMARLDETKENSLQQMELFETGELGYGEPKRVPIKHLHRVVNMGPSVSKSWDASGAKSEPGTDSNMGLIIKLNDINKREKENTPARVIFLKNEFVQNAVKDPGAEPSLSRPEITEVLTFFKKNNYPDIEAKKFFNHYQSNGWLVGGNTPMNDWHSSARKWMLNAEKFTSSPTGKNPGNTAVRADLNKNKDFGEPL